MKDVREGDRLQDMRRRLYARTSAEESVAQAGLTDHPVDVSRNWNVPVSPSPDELVIEASSEPDKPRRRYRTVILVASLLIFIFGVGLSSIYLYFGGNQISSAQIAVSLNGPLSVGGGEVLDLQVGLANENEVTIESATLILTYPPGTRSVGDVPRSVFEERIPVTDLTPGEVRTVPVRVAVFGEEQSEHMINATLEYRIAGSNGTFYKDADPLSYTISSSPISVRVAHVEKVVSGQTIDVTITVASNASTPQDDLLLVVDTPTGFLFESAQPAPVFGETVWSLDTLEPGGTAQVVLRGMVTGLTEEAFRINLDVGPQQLDNQFLLGSVLSEASADFTIERAFIDVQTTIDDVVNGTAVLAEGRTSQVKIDVTNTLDQTVYDLLVEVIPGGNSLTEESISANSGFFDSNTGTVRWEVANNSTFAEVNPGDSRALSFSVTPASARSTASYDLVVNVYARRVAEVSASEQLLGTSQAAVKFNSAIFTGAQAGRGGVFTDTGVIPPVVGSQTTYTLTMVAEAGVNDISDTVVRTSLPVYVDWLEQTQGDGEVTFNPVSNELEWLPGNISANSRKELSFQVGFTPSVSQVGSSPTLLNQQVFTGIDRFTDARLRATSDSVATELSTEAGYPEENGRVVR